MINHRINLGIMAHVDAGKTTVSEGFLYCSGLLSAMGSVDKGTTVTDSMALEQKRGMTIRASTISFTVGDTKINLIDTPGHMDFIAEVERSLTVLDGVVLVISAKEGVQPQTRVIFHQLTKMKMPVILFVNKIDRAGVDIEEIHGQIKNLLTHKCISMQQVTLSPDKGSLVESYAWSEPHFLEQFLLLSSKQLLEKYLDGTVITERDYIGSMRFRVQKAKIVPIYYGAALKQIGIEELLRGITLWFSKPFHRHAEEKLSAYVYKLEWDNKHRKRAYVRVFSGRMLLRGKVPLVRNGVELTIKNMYCLSNGKQLPAEEILSGDICILTDMEDLRCGDFLGVPLPHKGSASLGRPLLQVSIRETSDTSRSDLLSALQELTAEDPLLSVAIRQETGEITAHLFGPLQQEVLETLLSERYGLSVCFEGLKTIRRKTPLQAADAAIPIFSPGNLHYAGIVLRLEPLPPGSGIQYESKVSYGFIEKSFQSAVEDGVYQGLQNCLDESVTDVKVTFIGADYDSVLSTPADYRRLSPAVVKKALLLSGTKYIKPFMRYRLIFPLHDEKAVISSLIVMKATMETVEYHSEEVLIHGVVAYDAAKDFLWVLQSMTEGKGIFEMDFLEFR